MDNKKHQEGSGCNCTDCGRDLYDESNVLLEIKSAMDMHLDNTNPNTVGRPLYVIVIGDEGYELSASPINYIDGRDNNKMLIHTLKDMIKYLKSDSKKHK